MIPRHGVGGGDVPVPVAEGDGEALGRLCLPGRQGRELPAAAADLRPFQGEEEVAAVRADVEAHPAEIAGAAVILPQLAPEEGLGVHPQELREPGQEGDVRGSRPALPLADGLAADAELFPQLRLGEILALPQGPDEAAGLGLIHGWFLRFSVR